MIDPISPINSSSDTFQTAGALIALFAATWGGLVSYLWRVKNGLKFSLFSWLCHMSMSGFAGFICWLGCQHFKVDPGLTAGCCGLAGHMGAQFIALIEDRFGAAVGGKISSESIEK